MKFRTKRSLRPRVRLNMAMTADGKIATANRVVSSFSSRRDRDHMLALRAAADAVMAGARTVDLAKVHLGPGALKYRRLRLRHGLAEFNLRIVVSGSGSLDPGAEIFRHRFSPVLVLTTRRISKARLLRLQAVTDDVRICGQNQINFHAALRWLRTKWNVKSLLCEGGGELNDALFRADLVDEIHLTICPKIFGGRRAPTISDGIGAPNLPAARSFRVKSIQRQKDELFTVLERV